MKRVVNGVTEVLDARDLSNPNFKYVPNPTNVPQNNSYNQEEKSVEIPKNCGQVQVMKRVVNGPNGPVETIVSAVDLSKER
jgi:hypothetical protein